jgi:hypothetical protein
LLTIEEASSLHIAAYWRVGGHQRPHHILRGHDLGAAVRVRCKVLVDLLKAAEVADALLILEEDALAHRQRQQLAAILRDEVKTVACYVGCLCR